MEKMRLMIEDIDENVKEILQMTSGPADDVPDIECKDCGHTLRLCDHTETGFYCPKCAGIE